MYSDVFSMRAKTVRDTWQQKREGRKGRVVSVGVEPDGSLVVGKRKFNCCCCSLLTNKEPGGRRSIKLCVFLPVFYCDYFPVVFRSFKDVKVLFYDIRTHFSTFPPSCFQNTLLWVGR